MTFTYNGPGQDPVTAAGTGRTMKEGDFENLFLWQSGDPIDRFFIMDADTGDDVVRILTYNTQSNWWKYKINTSSREYRRRKKDDSAWSSPQPMTNLFIRINEPGEIPHRIETIDLGGTNGDYVRIEYLSCVVILNPATRRYQRVCRA